MQISDAVRRAVANGDGDQWMHELPLSKGLPHIHAALMSRPDGWDATIFQNAAGPIGASAIGKITHVERSDGTLQPWLMFDRSDMDRRAHGCASSRDCAR